MRPMAQKGLMMVMILNLQQLYFICSNSLICSMSLVGHRSSVHIVGMSKKISMCCVHVTLAARGFSLSERRNRRGKTSGTGHSEPQFHAPFD